MACSCRAAALRIFVRGVTQVHQLESSASVAPTILQARGRAWHTDSASRLVSFRQLRALHGTRSQHLDDAVSVAPNLPIDTSSDGARTQTYGEAQTVPKEKEAANPASHAGTEASSSSQTKDLNAKTDSRSRPRKPRADESESPQADRPKRKSRKVPGAGNITMDAAVAATTRPAMKEVMKRRARADADAHVDQSPELPPNPPRQKPAWAVLKEANQKKLEGPWRPRKWLSPDALAGIRALNAQFPDVYNTPTLAEKFEVSPEVIRRILKSKWQPSAEEEEERQQRWFRRGMSVWERQAALGIEPPKKWRREGIARDPEYHRWSKRVSEEQRKWEEAEDAKYRERLEAQKKGGNQEGSS